VRRLYRAGVPLLAGSDAVPAFALTVPGFTLHDELLALRRAGAAVLRAATLEPAHALGAPDSLGTVAAGKVAGLVLLDADPLADIRSARRIRAVVLSGRYFDMFWLFLP
jgi:imidazolonepropionase-like amidohydrolase